MKKVFTLIAMAMMTIAANAQIVFVDPEGKEYANGETMVITSTTKDWGDGDIEIVFESPSVVNKGNTAANVAFDINVTVLPENTCVQYCYPNTCQMCNEVKLITTAAGAVAAGETKSIATEWQCYDSEIDDFAYGTCTIVFTAYENGQKGNTVTVNYVHADEAGINAANNAVKVVKTYDLQGREAAGAKGLVIEKLSNGSVRKVIK